MAQRETRRSADSAELQRTYVQPSVRTTTRWSPQLVRSVLNSADAGNLSRLADLCDVLLGDDRIGADMGTRAASLFALPFEFVGEDEALAGALGEDFDVLNPPEELIQLHTWGRIMGVGVAELVYPDGLNESGRRVPSLCVWHPKHLKWSVHDRQWSVRTGHGGGTTELVEPGNGKWIVYTPYGATRPWARGLWRGLALWWLLKQYARDDWGAHSEHASRLVAENTNEFDSESTRKELARTIAEAGRGGVIAPPSNYVLKLIESSASTSDLFEAQINTANTAITIAIRGQNLATEVQGGSFAAASVHQDVDARRLEQDAGALSSCLTTQELVPYVSINFGPGREVPVPTWDTSPPEDEHARASVLSTVAEGAERFSALGAPLDLGWLAETFGLVFDEDEVQRARDARQNVQQNDSTPGAQALGDRPRRLRSGDRLASAAGFVQGQGYADALVDRGIEAGGGSLDRMLDDLSSLVDEIDSLEDARQRLLDYYDQAPEPEALAQGAERLFMLAQIAGVASVIQDAPESG